MRLDSGNLVELSREVRRILDRAGLREAKIMATGDLNEYKILELVAVGAPIDSFGVGTELATSADLPSLSAVYKLVELDAGGVRRYTAKFSEDKSTVPGAKQVFRYPDHDLVALSTEFPSYRPDGSPETLLRPVVLGGKLAEPLPSAAESRDYAGRSIVKLPLACRSLFEYEPPWRVEYSPDLRNLQVVVRHQVDGAVP